MGLKIVAISDLHGLLPEEGVIPECDILLIGGDVSPLYNHGVIFQRSWLETNFSNWLNEQPAKHIVGIGGNHDFALEGHRQTFGYKLPWNYLNNESIDIEGLKIWGSPLSNRYGNWANMKTEAGLSDVWRTIPRDIDILLTHGPAYGYGDRAPVKYGLKTKTRVGSPSLTNQLDNENWPNLKLHVQGHIHCDYGGFKRKDVLHTNVAWCDDDYKEYQSPLVLDWDTMTTDFFMKENERMTEDAQGD